jgi:glycosyltransferase involved in cell wall biosynthesis
MKILIVTQYWYDDHFGGSYKVAADQAKQLIKKGHTVTVLCERFYNKLPKYKKTTEGIKIYRYGSESISNKWAGSSRAGVYQLPKKLKEIKGNGKKWDIAILHHPFPAYGFFKAKLKIPALYLFHASTKREVEIEGTNRNFSDFQPIVSKLFKTWVGVIEKKALKKSNKISVLSNFSKQILLETYPFCKDKMTILPSGMDLKKFVPGDLNKSRDELKISKNKKILLTVRRLTPRMGLDNLIDAMKEVVKHNPDTRLIIVGQGNLKNELQNKIDNSRLSTNIKLLGKVPENKLQLYYNAADLFVLPTIAFEGLGISTLEALASGLPVLGTPIGATPELLEKIDSNLITNSVSPSDLSDKINEYLNKDQKEMEKLKKECRQMVKKNFTWSKAIKELEGVLKNL